jgi:hypothetical protein
MAGRKPLLNTLKRQEVMQWLRESPSYRVTKWKDIPKSLDLGISYGLGAIYIRLKV